ncbi:RNA-binding domain-containing protein [Corynespora cassiicola Philippines]|uniref:RNA-binding domain-containing protein n=1 Tax=Corynespora cassiicola Philippines TaxID=1448308 RepID=A0A2T2NEV4_CORCC|nr:RNA-binding domain-containing protein [Corynespora cassiicola Philippines]
MAPEDTKNKKRKVASDSAPKPKKQKKSEDVAAPKKPAKASKAAAKPVDDAPAESKQSRKQAEDFFSDDNAPAKVETAKEKKSKKKSKAAADANGTEEAVAVAVEVSESKDKPKKKAKKEKVVVEEEEAPAAAPKEKAKKTKKTVQSEEVEVEVAPPAKGKKAKAATEEESASKKTKKAKASKKQQPKEDTPEVDEAFDEEGEAEEDDQTVALLAGFESDRDESDLEKDGADFDESAEPHITKEKRLALEKAAKNTEEPGVVFLGRIPHGFYEPQMKKYFAQFGQITKLRLSRNKKTGASKHYAFIEFKSAEVAEIVAKTMNNYLMFNHILQCRVVPPAQVHPELFKGANERFTRDPRNKKAGLEMERGAERGVWEKRVAKESKRRTKASEKLKADFGYEFTAPTLKAVEDVPMTDAPLENSADQQLLTEAAAAEAATPETKPAQVTVTETVKVKKPKKGSKAKDEPVVETTVVTEEVVEPAAEKPAKKSRKRKSDVAEAVAEEKPETPVKPKKAKKEVAKAEEVVAEEDTPKEKKRRTRSAAADEAPAKTKKAKKAKA